MNLNKNFILALLSLALAGCVSYSPHPVDPVQSAAQWETRSLDSAPLHEFLTNHLRQPPLTWPLASWNLEQLTAAAFLYNPTLEVARAQWHGAEAAQQSAGERPNPTLSLAPGYDFTATSLGANPWLPGGTLDVPIETMGKRGYRKAQARAEVESSRLALTQAAWHVYAQVRENLLSYKVSAQRRELLERQNTNQKKLVDSMKKRQEAGAVGSSEVTLVQVAWHKTELDLMDAIRQQTDALHSLANGIGLPAAALQKVQMDFDPDSVPKLSDDLSLLALRDSGLRHRSDIQGALADYAASEAALQLQIAKQYPDVHLAPNYQYNQGDHQFLLGISAELPIFNQNQGPIAEAKSKRDEMAARFYETQTHAIGEIEHAFESYQQSLAGNSSLQSLADSQKQQAAAVRAQSQAGAADALDLLNAEVEIVSGELLRLDAQWKLQQAFGALENAVQSPIEWVDAGAIEKFQKSRKEKKP